MRFEPDDVAAQATEAVMKRLKVAEVLRPDEPNHPTHYNRAFSEVYAVMRQFMASPTTSIREADGSDVNLEVMKIPQWLRQAIEEKFQ